MCLSVILPSPHFFFFFFNFETGSFYAVRLAFELQDSSNLPASKY